MKHRIFFISLFISCFVSLNAQNINTSKVYQKGILKTKTKDTTQPQTAPVTYSSKNDTVLPVIKGKPNTYSYSTGKKALIKQQYIKRLTSKGKKRLKSTGNYETETDSLKLISSETDNLGFRHSKYRQYHKGVKVDGAILIIHEKNGTVTHINGNFFKGLDIDINPKLSIEKAYRKALKIMNIKDKEFNDSINYEIIITPINGIYEIQNFRLTYKFVINDFEKGESWNVYIDAHSGEMVNKISNTHYGSVTGNATTIYNGDQTITTDYSNSIYTLVDSTRNIFTYNGIGDTTWGLYGDKAILPPDSPTNFTDLDNNWQSGYFLSTITIESVSSSWWHTFLADETPDIYIKIFDGNNKLIWISSAVSNTNPTITFPNIYLFLSNPPYTLELWDYDAANDDDFGGQYTIPLLEGDNLYSDYGNSGIITIDSLGHPATDVHWGLIKTYDFFQSKFGRNSYDDNGKKILSWINPTFRSGWKNGDAFAFHLDYLGEAYDYMCYGLGNFLYNPVVSLDIVAHEFTHMVTNYTDDLKYQGESGALNEGFSDIFATCVEFYIKGTSANWNIGEGVTKHTPYLRSMSNPSSNQLVVTINNKELDWRQPSTYKTSPFWTNTDNIDDDHGGVHMNNGVFNHWFYLLSEGGSGTNDNDNSYNVIGIGKDKAIQIAYRMKLYYLTEISGFFDAYLQSLKAAEDLYGSNSTEWWEVKRAWYAVGVINTDPDKFCDGTVEISETSGTISDGSGGTDYAPNSSCKWLIKPVGATSITIDFTSFNTELDWDSVIVYSSINDGMAYAQLIWSGNTLPPQVNISGGAALIEFISDGSIQNSGWELNYSSTTVPTCHGYEILSDTTGTINDNSGTGDYGNNQTCLWIIAPPGAQTIGLDVTMLDTEQDYDGLMVFDGEPDFKNLTNHLGTFTGNTLPSDVYAFSGEMWVLFVSDPFITGDGFSANYFSSSEPYCQGTETYTEDFGFIRDGSGDSNYYHNSNCSWLIQPQDANSIRLEFTEFELEEAEEDGKSYYDYVSIYDGSDEFSSLLGKYAGNNLPNSVSSTGSSLFVKFSSDLRKQLNGFSAFYQTITPVYCNSNNTFTSSNDTLSDGSGLGQYGNNSDCQFLIQPPSADSIILNFIDFSTEKNYDGVIIYDGSDTTGIKLATLTGDTIPNPIVAQSGSMFLWFLSDETVRGDGWKATYNTKLVTQTPLISEDNKETGIHPNPTTGIIYLPGRIENQKVEITDVNGKKMSENKITSGKIDLNFLPSGTYLVKYQVSDKFVEEIIILMKK